eukprot:4845938-Pleurochrysis_carterae.AAC.1
MGLETDRIDKTKQAWPHEPQEDYPQGQGSRRTESRQQAMGMAGSLFSQTDTRRPGTRERGRCDIKWDENSAVKPVRWLSHLAGSRMKRSANKAGSRWQANGLQNTGQTQTVLRHLALIVNVSEPQRTTRPRNPGRKNSASAYIESREQAQQHAGPGNAGQGHRGMGNRRHATRLTSPRRMWTDQKLVGLNAEKRKEGVEQENRMAKHERTSKHPDNLGAKRKCNKAGNRRQTNRQQNTEPTLIAPRGTDAMATYGSADEFTLRGRDSRRRGGVSVQIKGSAQEQADRGAEGVRWEDAVVENRQQTSRGLSSLRTTRDPEGLGSNGKSRNRVLTAELSTVTKRMIREGHSRRQKATSREPINREHGIENRRTKDGRRGDRRAERHPQAARGTSLLKTKLRIDVRKTQGKRWRQWNVTNRRTASCVQEHGERRTEGRGQRNRGTEREPQAASRLSLLLEPIAPHCTGLQKEMQNRVAKARLSFRAERVMTAQGQETGMWRRRRRREEGNERGSGRALGLLLTWIEPQGHEPHYEQKNATATTRPSLAAGKA